MRQSISCFASVADGQNHDLLPVVVIPGDVSALPEFNHPLAKLRWQILDRAAHLRVLVERFHTLPNGLDGALCCVLALRRQKLMETGTSCKAGRDQFRRDI